ncbi:39S ribosomal protein L22, mitochondrial [Liparis tanakae]|uniref:39S ribosomal protein L22, mitochondrial n=1 Tax=Liparis tanakae TaxID=230148 RepID=A0A4Z2EDR1_9TELE|nr:39S ribosomal protein L22, mitochondrial [Liparis tanakae]
MMFLAPTPNKPLPLTSLQREQYQLGEAGSDRSCMMPLVALPVLGPQQLSCLHTSASLDSKTWERRNLKMFPPQQPDDARRPAEVHHSRRQIKYSKDKMWYLAKLVRHTAEHFLHNIISCLKTSLKYQILKHRFVLQWLLNILLWYFCSLTMLRKCYFLYSCCS